MLATLDHADKLFRYCDTHIKAALLDKLDLFPFAAFIGPDDLLVALRTRQGPERATHLQILASLEELFVEMLGDGRAFGHATAALVKMPKDLRSRFRDAILVHVYVPGILHTYTYMTYEVQPWQGLRKLMKIPLVKYFETVVLTLPDASSATSPAT